MFSRNCSILYHIPISVSSNVWVVFLTNFCMQLHFAFSEHFRSVMWFPNYIEQHQCSYVQLTPFCYTYSYLVGPEYPLLSPSKIFFWVNRALIQSPWISRYCSCLTKTMYSGFVLCVSHNLQLLFSKTQN